MSNLRLGFSLRDKKLDNNSTPRDLYNDLNEEFQFNFDPCPLHGEEIQDGLKVDWKSSNFVNPPFSEISKWLNKGVEEMKKGNKSVFLITARTSTKYWEKYVYPFACEIRFILGRVPFGDHKEGFPFPICLVIFDPLKQVNNLEMKRVNYKYNKWIRYH